MLDAHAGGRGACRLGLFAFLVTLFPVTLFLATLVTGCKDEPKATAQYGEPVGIEIEAHAAIPRIALAVAVTKGRDVTKVVSGVAGAIHTAAASCPSFVAAMSAGSATRLEFVAKANILYPPQVVPDDVAGACMLSAISGKRIDMDRPDKLDVIVELRPTADASSHGP